MEYLAKGDAVFKRPGQSAWDVGHFVVIVQVSASPSSPRALIGANDDDIYLTPLLS